MFGGQQSNEYGACLEPQALSIATLRGGPADPLPAYWLALPSFFPCRVHDDELLSSNIATGGALTMASGAIEAAHQRLGG
jgi:hypothetical protein